MLRSSYQFYEQQKVGFMYGFDWQRTHAIDYKKFKQVWFGPQQFEYKVFEILHRKIETTRLLPQHIQLQRYKLVCDIILAVIVVIIIVSAIDNSQARRQQYLVVNGVFGFVMLILRFLNPIVSICIKKPMRRKINEAILSSNQFINQFGFQARLGQKSKTFCLCIPFCDCFFRKVDWDRIDIYSTSKKQFGYQGEQIQMTAALAKEAQLSSY